MTPADFLLSFTRAIASMGLYGVEHPTRLASIDKSYEQLMRLLDEDPHPRFNFLVDEVVYGRRTLRELDEWDWARRLANAGLQRLEIDAGVSAEEYARFLADVEARLGGRAVSSAEMRATVAANIRFGAVGLHGESTGSSSRGALTTATLSYNLSDEAAAVRWIHGELEAGRPLALLEAEAVVRSLTVALHSHGPFVLPLVRLKEFDQYTTTHSLNVGVLAMALAEALGFAAPDVRAFGTAGLLHDIGKVRVPKDILVKPGMLTPEERAVLDRHPVDGAHLIIESDDRLGLSAAVAYEHHIMIDGRGYPQLHYRRDCHYASRVVHVCDVFDALCTDRPYRDAWEIERTLRYIEERSGTEFDGQIAATFVDLMRRMACQPASLQPAETVAPAAS